MGMSAMARLSKGLRSDLLQSRTEIAEARTLASIANFRANGQQRNKRLITVLNHVEAPAPAPSSRMPRLPVVQELHQQPFCALTVV